jgi:hypothetical protein
MSLKSATVMRDMKNSMDVISKAEPIIKNLLNGGRIIRIEGSDEEICKFLDTKCGTDYFQYYQYYDLTVGVASRVQYGKNWRTFTVRKERESGNLTEFEKRKVAIENGGIYPFLTMQIYVVDGDINGIGIAKTKDLIEYIESGYANVTHTRSDKIGQAGFYYCQWDDFKEKGYWLKEYAA